MHLVEQMENHWNLHIELADVQVSLLSIYFSSKKQNLNHPFSLPVRLSPLPLRPAPPPRLCWLQSHRPTFLHRPQCPCFKSSRRRVGMKWCTSPCGRRGRRLLLSSLSILYSIISLSLWWVCDAGEGCHVPSAACPVLRAQWHVVVGSLALVPLLLLLVLSTGLWLV